MIFLGMRMCNYKAKAAGRAAISNLLILVG